MVSGRLDIVAVSMEELSVVDHIPPPLDLGDDVIDFERFSMGEEQPAFAASPLLSLQQASYSR